MFDFGNSTTMSWFFSFFLAELNSLYGFPVIFFGHYSVRTKLCFWQTAHKPLKYVSYLYFVFYLDEKKRYKVLIGGAGRQILLQLDRTRLPVSLCPLFVLRLSQPAAVCSDRLQLQIFEMNWIKTFSICGLITAEQGWNQDQPQSTFLLTTNVYAKS